MSTQATSLPVERPYDLELTVRLLQRRPTNRIDAWDAGCYRRALWVGSRLSLCTLRNAGTIDAPDLRLTVEPRPSEAVLAALKDTLRRMLGMDLPPGFTLPNLSSPRLASLAQRLRGARPPRFPDLFESFCRIIPYQQVSIEAGSTLVARLVERLGRRLETDAGPVWGFPHAATIADAGDDDFDGLGLSRTKVAALREAARRIASGALSESALTALPTPRALQELDALPGVGPWTAALLLLRGLGRTEVFPQADVGALKGLRRVLGEDAPLAAIIEAAGNRRGYLYFYALAAKLVEKGVVYGAG